MADGIMIGGQRGEGVRAVCTMTETHPDYAARRYMVIVLLFEYECDEED